MHIPIYKAELDIKDRVLINTAQAVCAITNDLPEVTKFKLQLGAREKLERAFGATADSFDLFPLYSILVTVGWNNNDDVFGRAETWQARYTPEDKPFNLEHEPSRIIGHITASCAVDENFLPIDDEILIDDLPDKYHLLTSAVIYRPANNKNPEWTEATNKLIEEINNGEWLVSMECLFGGFDYAVADTTGKRCLVARNEQTAFLTKKLRRYGGEGKYNGYSIGRYLKDITFSGKGLTHKPANPESVIFTDTDSFNGIFASADILLEKSGVNNNEVQILRENEMSENKSEAVEKELGELKTQVASLTEQLEKSAGDYKDSVAKVDELQTSVASRDTEVAKLNETIVAKDNEIETFKTRVTELTTAEADLSKKYAEAEDKISALSMSVTKANRTISLYQYDMSPDEITDVVTKFVSMADEQFNEMVSLIANKKKKDKQDNGTAKSELADTSTASVQNAVESVEQVSQEIPASTSANEVETKAEKAINDVRQMLSELLTGKKS